MFAKLAESHAIEGPAETRRHHDVAGGFRIPTFRLSEQSRHPQRRLLFFIWPDAAAIDQITNLTAGLVQGKILSGKLVDADRLHLTLHCLGNFVDQMPASLITTASMAAETLRMEPFKVTFDRLGGTGNRFLLRPSDRLPGLMQFQQGLLLALMKAGLRPRKSSIFRPHLTLSYNTRDVPEQRVESISWTVSRFALVESVIGKQKYIEHKGWKISQQTGLEVV